jgi:trimethylamine monooxygenase
LNVDGVNEAFIRWKHDKKDDIMGYRNHAFCSLITGNQSPRHHTPWLDELDDSLESFLTIPSSQGLKQSCSKNRAFEEAQTLEVDRE